MLGIARAVLPDPAVPFYLPYPGFPIPISTWEPHPCQLQKARGWDLELGNGTAEPCREGRRGQGCLLWAVSPQGWLWQGHWAHSCVLPCCRWPGKGSWVPAHVWGWRGCPPASGQAGGRRRCCPSASPAALWQFRTWSDADNCVSLSSAWEWSLCLSKSFGVWGFPHQGVCTWAMDLGPVLLRMWWWRKAMGTSAEGMLSCGQPRTKAPGSSPRA